MLINASCLLLQNAGMAAMSNFALESRLCMYDKYERRLYLEAGQFGGAVNFNGTGAKFHILSEPSMFELIRNNKLIPSSSNASIHISRLDFLLSVLSFSWMLKQRS